MAFHEVYMTFQYIKNDDRYLWKGQHADGFSYQPELFITPLYWLILNGGSLWSYSKHHQFSLSWHAIYRHTDEVVHASNQIYYTSM